MSADEHIRGEIFADGSIHIHVGPMSLRFSRASFERLAEFVEKLRTRLIQIDRGRPATLASSEGAAGGALGHAGFMGPKDKTGEA